jgi:hypothetical protein
MYRLKQEGRPSSPEDPTIDQPGLAKGSIKSRVENSHDKRHLRTEKNRVFNSI